MNSTPPILRSATVVRNLENSFKNSQQDRMVKIELEDIEDEVNYWKPSLVCYVLGANPPLHVLEGFAKRKWNDNVDKVKLLAYGVFLIRFHSVGQRDEVLNGGYIFFNRKPVIMKPWDPNVSIKKEDVKMVPIWIQLEDLDLKYWGEKSLFKIVGQLGKPIMVDAITRERERLMFPRVLIEVSIEQELPGLIEFVNEYGSTTTVIVQYEWKPTLCQQCHGMGHVTAECKKMIQPKKEWIVKKDNRGVNKKIILDEEGFQPVSGGKKSRLQEAPAETELQNTFSVLIAAGGEKQDYQEVEIGAKQNNTREGGDPSLGNG
ncbi:uncharacterized protein LOC115695300 [Cannabis sativa]|uniref:uncharacterized protein LOC115695300 n=1 Tax=Cannabis sativa TaxID=3483 RepID=UPI0011DFD5C2|nr:uncharacterized protein LOC115695300 [Cannabis sativa]